MLATLFGFLSGKSYIPVAPKIPDVNHCNAYQRLPDALLMELKSVVLRPIDQRPMLGRYKPTDINGRKIKNVHLWELLCVELKPTPATKKITYWAPRHPVLKEILSKVERV